MSKSPQQQTIASTIFTSSVILWLGYLNYIDNKKYMKPSRSKLALQSDAKDDNNDESGSFQRSSSEYSLGLCRSQSINRELNEFGALCQTGQIFVFVIEIISVASLASLGFYRFGSFIVSIMKSIDKKR
jgi:hypothetical protein